MREYGCFLPVEVPRLVWMIIGGEKSVNRGRSSWGGTKGRSSLCPSSLPPRRRRRLVEEHGHDGRHDEATAPWMMDSRTLEGNLRLSLKFFSGFNAALILRIALADTKTNSEY